MLRTTKHRTSSRPSLEVLSRPKSNLSGYPAYQDVRKKFGLSQVRHPERPAVRVNEATGLDASRHFDLIEQLEHDGSGTLTESY
jgi:hypothetical protein